MPGILWVTLVAHESTMFIQVSGKKSAADCYTDLARGLLSLAQVGFLIVLCHQVFKKQISKQTECSQLMWQQLLQIPSCIPWGSFGRKAVTTGKVSALTTSVKIFDFGQRNVLSAEDSQLQQVCTVQVDQRLLGFERTMWNSWFVCLHIIYHILHLQLSALCQNWFPSGFLLWPTGQGHISCHLSSIFWSSIPGLFREHLAQSVSTFVSRTYFVSKALTLQDCGWATWPSHTRSWTA